MINMHLRWIDPDPSRPTNTLIYRAETYTKGEPFDGKLIATLPTSEGHYQDRNLEPTKVYYYRLVQQLKGKNSVGSKVFSFIGEDNRGPGPKEIVFGDARFGYYGEVPESDIQFPSLSDLRRILFDLPPGLTEGLPAIPHKFIVKGKSTYILPYPMANGAEISFTQPNLQTLMLGGWFEIQFAGHKWTCTLPYENLAGKADDSAERESGTFPLMIDAISNMYARVVDTVYGNVSGERVTVNYGGIDFYENVARVFPLVKSGNILTATYVTGPVMDRESVLIKWSPKIGTAGSEYPNLLHPEEYPNPATDPNVADIMTGTFIWPVFTYAGRIDQ